MAAYETIISTKTIGKWASNSTLHRRSSILSILSLLFSSSLPFSLLFSLFSLLFSLLSLLPLLSSLFSLFSSPSSPSSLSLFSLFSLFSLSLSLSLSLSFLLLFLFLDPDKIEIYVEFIISDRERERERERVRERENLEDRKGDVRLTIFRGSPKRTHRDSCPCSNVVENRAFIIAQIHIRLLDLLISKILKILSVLFVEHVRGQEQRVQAGGVGWWRCG